MQRCSHCPIFALGGITLTLGMLFSPVENQLPLAQAPLVPPALAWAPPAPLHPQPWLRHLLHPQPHLGIPCTSCIPSPILGTSCSPSSGTSCTFCTPSPGLGTSCTPSPGLDTSHSHTPELGELLVPAQPHLTAFSCDRPRPPA